uniref:Serpentine receptor class gamma n=1 Tax=Panagrellus redivivus TaxID=6233 RepID=A0A7E4VMW3_PANRE
MHRTVMSYVSIGVRIIGMTAETLFIIFFTLEFKKKQSVVKFGYYYILYVSFVADLLHWITYICNGIGNGDLPFFAYFLFFLYHSTGKETVLINLISNSLLVALSLIILFAGIRYSKLSNNKANAKRERSMILHALISSISIVFGSVMNYLFLYVDVDNEVVWTVLKITYLIESSFEQCFPLIAVVWINEPFRCALFKFLKLNKVVTRSVTHIPTIS